MINADTLAEQRELERPRLASSNRRLRCQPFHISEEYSLRLETKGLQARCQQFLVRRQLGLSKQSSPTKPSSDVRLPLLVDAAPLMYTVHRFTQVKWLILTTSDDNSWNSSRLSKRKRQTCSPLRSLTPFEDTIETTERLRLRLIRRAHLMKGRLPDSSLADKPPCRPSIPTELPRFSRPIRPFGLLLLRETRPPDSPDTLTTGLVTFILLPMSRIRAIPFTVFDRLPSSVPMFPLDCSGLVMPMSSIRSRFVDRRRVAVFHLSTQGLHTIHLPCTTQLHALLISLRLTPYANPNFFHVLNFSYTRLDYTLDPTDIPNHIRTMSSEPV